jgi:uncharacterized RDD family membrane protein YckC
MPDGTIVTGEAVPVELQLARLPSRILALLVDSAAQGIGLAIFLAIALAPGGLDGAGRAALITTASAVVLIGYPFGFESLWRGRTPGKAVLGLRVVSDTGGPIRARQALVRALAGTFVEKPGITLYFGGLISAALSAKGKRLGDMLAGTVVLAERVAGPPAHEPMMPPALATWAASTDLSRLDDAFALSIRSFLSRAAELDPAARTHLGNQLLGSLTALITPAPPAAAPGWAVLTAVLAERRRRSLPGTASPADAVPRPPVEPRPAHSDGFAPPA